MIKSGAESPSRIGSTVAMPLCMIKTVQGLNNSGHAMPHPPVLHDCKPCEKIWEQPPCAKLRKLGRLGLFRDFTGQVRGRGNGTIPRVNVEGVGFKVEVGGMFSSAHGL